MSEQPPPIVLQEARPTNAPSYYAFAWALLLLFGAGMGALAFHPMPKEQLTIFSGFFGAVIGSGLTTFVQWAWGAAMKRPSPDTPTQS